MTPPATAVASDVQSLARPAPRTRNENRLECDIHLDSATYSLSRITIRMTDAHGLHRWRKRLFVAVARHAASPVDFRLPHGQPITMGWQVPP